MKGDFTRLGFDPLQHFTRVLMQQGRVQLDADWNEWQEISLYRERTALLDLAAPNGVPAGRAGFQIALTSLANDLTLSSGCMYVGGILCENPSAGVTLSNQPFLSAGAPGLVWPTASGRYLAYLDVWERTLSALEAPIIRETALGGPDTTARTRLIWQLRLEPVLSTAATEDFPPGWSPAAFAGARGAMLPSTIAAPPAGPCVLPQGAAYTSLTNQLYRVEVQTSGTLNADGSGSPTPMFKWSRDNGTVATTVLTVAGQTLSLGDLGPDDVPNAQSTALTFQPGQVVEIADEQMSLGGQAGVLLLIASVDRVNKAVTLDPATPVPAVDLTQPVILRRWDQPGTPGSAVQALSVAAGPIALEAGLQVSFQPGFYRAGDAWTVPARTAIDAETGNIIWPSGIAQPAPGIVHAYAPLAIVDFVAPSGAATPPDGVFSIVEDCRAGFAPGVGRFAPMLARYADGSRLRTIASGQSISADKLAAGLMLATPTPLDPGSVSPSSIQLIAELPVTNAQLLPQSTDQTVVGSQLVSLRTACSLATPNRIVVTPNQAALSLLTGALARKLSMATQQDFVQLFTTADFGAAATHAAWQVGADGSLQQTAAAAVSTVGGGLAALTPSLALAAAAPSTTPDAIFLTVSYPSSNPADIGLVFNWTSNADFWVFYASRFSEAIGFSGGYDAYGLYLVHYVNGQAAVNLSTGGLPVPIGGNQVPSWTASLDIGTNSQGLTFSGTFHWSTGGSSTQAVSSSAAPAALLSGARLGVMARGNGPMSFTALQWFDAATNTPTNILPIGGTAPILMRLIARRSQLRSFAEAQAGAAALPVTPQPDFETSFFVTPAPPGYYPLAGGFAGIGADLL